MTTCPMAADPLWRGKPRVCQHSKVLASGGTCGSTASNTLETENQESDYR